MFSKSELHMNVKKKKKNNAYVFLIFNIDRRITFVLYCFKLLT